MGLKRFKQVFFFFFPLLFFSCFWLWLLYFHFGDEGDPSRTRCVCTLSQFVPLAVRQIVFCLLAKWNIKTPGQCWSNQTWNVWLPLHLEEQWTCWQIQGAQQPDYSARGPCTPCTTVHSSASRVIFGACLPGVGLWSDLTAWCLGELQAWPGSVGNQQCVGLDCAVQN